MDRECVRLSWLDGGFLVARPEGKLTTSTTARLRAALLRCASELPCALIVDIRRLHLAEGNSLLAFESALAHIHLWPGIPVALVAEDAPRLDHPVPVYPDPASAVLAIEPPERRQVRLDLPWDNTSPYQARDFVRAVGQIWAIPDAVVDDAVAVVAELAENTVLHTRSTALLVLELHAETLAAAVFDEDPGLPVLRERTEDRFGIGLRIVANLAKNWGCAPTMAGGKAVWSLLRLRN